MRFLSLLTLVFMATSATAQPIDQALYQDLRYRLLGPFRASRTVGAVGVPAPPNVLQGADARPMAQARDGVRTLRETLDALTRRWEALR